MAEVVSSLGSRWRLGGEWVGSRGFPGWERLRWEWRIRGGEIRGACRGLRIGALAWSLPRWNRRWRPARGGDRIRDGRRSERRCHLGELRCSSGAWFGFLKPWRVGGRGEKLRLRFRTG